MKWEKTLKGTAYYDNDANDYYYQWVGLKLGKDESLVTIFEKYLGTGIGHDPKVVVKVRKGAILIEAEKETEDEG